ncbi:hypothetical protein [Jeotgalibaca porci]|uniref:hypothetical protein n=1 Tax=Jeotgalibaca porci TaxID=1868793 RepID=UPI00359F264C
MIKGEHQKISELKINLDVQNADEYEAIIKEISDKVYDLKSLVEKANKFKMKVGVGQSYIEVEVPPIEFSIEF